MKIFVRERRRNDSGNQRPRYRVVGVEGGDLKVYAKRVRKCELEAMAGATGAEVVYMDRDGEGKGGGKGRKAA